MRNQIRRYALGVIFIVLLAAVPAGAATSDDSGGFVKYLECLLTQLYDQSGLSLPPG
jgi:hypothetical protein